MTHPSVLQKPLTRREVSIAIVLLRRILRQTTLPGTLTDRSREEILAAVHILEDLWERMA